MTMLLGHITRLALCTFFICYWWTFDRRTLLCAKWHVQCLPKNGCPLPCMGTWVDCPELRRLSLLLCWLMFLAYGTKRYNRRHYFQGKSHGYPKGQPRLNLSLPQTWGRSSIMPIFTNETLSHIALRRYDTGCLNAISFFGVSIPSCRALSYVVFFVTV